jgi:8-oxo-dGTP pyrophosphatase MutT (NUDIX family)
MKYLKSYKMFEFRQQPTETVVGLLIKSRSTDRIFLVQRNDRNRYWSLLSGGQDETDNDDIHTIKREMREELRMNDPDSVEIVKVGDEIVAGGRRLFKYYQGFVDEEFSVILDDENLNWGWFDPKGISRINGESNTFGLPSGLYPGLIEKIQNICEK